MRFAVWYHFYNFKNKKNIDGGVLLLVTKSKTPPWVFFTFFKLYKWYQTAQPITLILHFYLNSNTKIFDLTTFHCACKVQHFHSPCLIWLLANLKHRYNKFKEKKVLKTILKVACRVKTNMTRTTKYIISTHYFSKKIKTNTFPEHERYMKCLELEIYNLHIQILAVKLTQFYIKILPFASSKSL